MSDQKAKVKSYVRRRLESWQHEPNPHQIRADLANLRRGIGKAPGDLPELWGLLFRDFPEELMSSTGEPTWAEWAVSGALTLYALHQQGAQRSMQADGQRQSASLPETTRIGSRRCSGDSMPLPLRGACRSACTICADWSSF